MMKSLRLLPLYAMLLSVSASAQTTSSDSSTQDASKGTENDGPRRFWQASVPGGEYMVAIDHIVSISRQTYLLDGALVVHEIDVETNGQALARFYYVEPPSTPSGTASQVIDRSKQVLEELGKRTSIDTQNMVTKKYPETTHSKCIEYRLTGVAELDSLYKSVKDAWESGKGRKFTIK